MDQEIKAEPPADAAAAFEALQREVALLNVAIAGLAAERMSAPDYSETLGEIAKGVSVAVGRIGKVMLSPALNLSPGEMARQIAAAGDEARRQDRSALQMAQESLQRAAGDLRGWIDAARLASLQNVRLLQAGLVGIALGCAFGVFAPTAITNVAPEAWAWPEKRAARILRRDLWSAGERMLMTADPERAQSIQAGSSILDLNAEVLAKCAASATSDGRPVRCTIAVPPRNSPAVDLKDVR